MCAHSHTRDPQIKYMPIMACVFLLRPYFSTLGIPKSYTAHVGIPICFCTAFCAEIHLIVVSALFYVYAFATEHSLYISNCISHNPLPCS